jgi:hypothetical protein
MMPPSVVPWSPMNFVSEFTTMVGPVLDRAKQNGCRHRIIDDQRHAMPVGDGSQGFDVADVAGRVTNPFAEHSTCVAVD